VLLIVSTFGPFSFVEAGILLVALAILFLLKKRAEGRLFHLPFGDGTVIALAGLWCAFLILVRLLDRPLGQNLLALACAAILLAAGVRERAKRPADDLPRERARRAGERRPGDWLAEEASASPADRDAPTRRVRGDPTRPLRDEPATRPPGGEPATRPIGDDAATRPLPDDPPEMRLPDER
jgi:hypothetical protein